MPIYRSSISIARWRPVLNSSRKEEACKGNPETYGPCVSRAAKRRARKARTTERLKQTYSVSMLLKTRSSKPENTGQQEESRKDEVAKLEARCQYLDGILQGQQGLEVQHHLLKKKVSDLELEALENEKKLDTLRELNKNLIAKQVRKSDEECPPVPRPSTGKGTNSIEKKQPQPCKAATSCETGMVTNWAINSSDLFPYHILPFVPKGRGQPYGDLDPEITARSNMKKGSLRTYFIVSTTELFKDMVIAVEDKGLDNPDAYAAGWLIGLLIGQIEFLAARKSLGSLNIWLNETRINLKTPEAEKARAEFIAKGILRDGGDQEEKKTLQEEETRKATESSSSRGPPEKIQEQVEHPDMSLPGRKSGPRAQTKGKKQHKRAGGR